MFFMFFLREERVVLKSFYTVYNGNMFQTKMSKPCFCNQIESTRSKIDFLDAHRSEIERGSRTSY